MTGRPSAAAGALALVAALAAARLSAAPDVTLPGLTEPVNDFAHVIDPADAAAIDRLSRALQAATGDVVVVATVQTIRPYGDIREYANKLFENRGRGIGAKGKDNGLLVLLAVDERRVWVEVGYSLEQWITDGFAGETSRLVMIPHFRGGQYGAGLRAGVERIVARIAEARRVELQDVPRPRAGPAGDTPLPLALVFAVFIAILILSRIGGGPGAGVRRWGRGGWSGWSSGVGPFGGGWTGGGGFGGGFGGFGGGGSGGGGGGGSW